MGMHIAMQPLVKDSDFFKHGAEGGKKERGEKYGGP